MCTLELKVLFLWRIHSTGHRNEEKMVKLWNGLSVIKDGIIALSSLLGF